ncbi:MAG: hypothetical protein AB7U05_00510 [Mangrovibacterium sp.]
MRTQKAVCLLLLVSFAGLLFILQATPLVEQKLTIKKDIDLKVGHDPKKGPPGIITVDLACLNAQFQASSMMKQATTLSDHANRERGSTIELSDNEEIRAAKSRFWLQN